MISRLRSPESDFLVWETYCAEKEKCKRCSPTIAERFENMVLTDQANEFALSIVAATTKLQSAQRGIAPRVKLQRLKVVATKLAFAHRRRATQKNKAATTPQAAHRVPPT
jgi:hypothetical protein